MRQVLRFIDYFFLLLGLIFFNLISINGKLYEPCELANELLKLKFLRKDIADWICLIRWESNFDTGAIGQLNSDGSLDHGLFQISDKFWCSNESVDGACGIHCKDLENEDIRDDSKCARRIHRVTQYSTKNGFDAWAGWKQHCQNQNVQAYISNCTLPEP